MSDFDYSSLSSDSSGEEEVIVTSLKKKKPRDMHIIKVSKELRLYYSRLFMDCAGLIDLFVKSKSWTYGSFLDIFTNMRFHQIYAKPKSKIQKRYVSPHHYITTTQDAIGVASKFLRSRSKKARIGTVYLLYILYDTQPLISAYPINIKMKPDDFRNTQELVDECLNEGLAYPAYCFYEMDMKKRITITANTINMCLEANYPRAEVRKHLGRVADKQFKIEYEERREFDPIDKLQLMEQQMRNELAYINRLSNMTLGHNVAPEYKPKLSKTFIEINTEKSVNLNQCPKNRVVKKLNKSRYKNKKNVAFPGKNDNILDDMVVIAETSKQTMSTINNCHLRNKLKKLKKRRKIGGNRNKNVASVLKEEPSTSITELNDVDSETSFDSASDDLGNAEDKYGDIIWRILEGQENNDIPSKNGPSQPAKEKNDDD